MELLEKGEIRLRERVVRARILKFKIKEVLEHQKENPGEKSGNREKTNVVSI